MFRQWARQLRGGDDELGVHGVRRLPGRGPRPRLLRLHVRRHVAVGVAGDVAAGQLGPVRLGDRRHAVRALPGLHRAVHPGRPLPVVHGGARHHVPALRRDPGGDHGAGAVSLAGLRGNRLGPKNAYICAFRT